MRTLQMYLMSPNRFTINTNRAPTMITGQITVFIGNHPKSAIFFRNFQFLLKILHFFDILNPFSKIFQKSHFYPPISFFLLILLPFRTDKQEIKTVRIVKRESERRHRDKDKMSSSYDPFNTDFVNTSDFASNYHHSSNEARANNYYDDDPSTAKAKMTIKNLSNARSAIKASTHKTDNIFQSNTAREIFNELASGKEDASKSMPKEQQTSKSGTLASIASASSASILYKRFTPRKKKRHNTAPNSENFMDFMAERDAYKYVSGLLAFLGGWSL